MVDRHFEGTPFRSFSTDDLIDEICDRFEVQWRARRSPALEDFLSQGRDEFQKALLRELLTVELEWRLKHGESPQPEEYYDRLPDFRTQIEAVFTGVPSQDSTAPVAPGGQPAEGGALRTDGAPRPPAAVGSVQVRCPSCHTPVEVSEQDPSQNIKCPSCGSHFNLLRDASAIECPPGSGRILGNFELLEQVGAGQFGVVWKARDLKLRRIVAVKIPRRGQFNQASLSQFQREARTAAQVNHAGIVSVFDVGRTEETIYIASEFVDGVSLEDWLAGQRLTPTEAARMCLKIADALQAAHQAGVVHRDLKPSNIMVDPAGEPHITDFGLAKRETGEVTVTVDGQILGTPAYMSPEQARGEGNKADPRMDVYAMGVILYELLTGERPFRGDLRMLLHQVVYDEPISPRRLNSRIPPDLESVCLKCLEKAPGRRYQTAGELADDLRRFLAGKPVRAVTVGALGRLWRWYTRNPVATVYAAGGYSTAWAALSILWSVFGITSLLSGYVPAANPRGLLRDLSLITLFVFVPGLWVGIRSLNGWLPGLWLAALLWLLGLAISIAGCSGLAFDPLCYGDTVTRRPLFSLMCILTLVGFLLQVIAILSQRIGPNAEKPARR